MCGSSLLNPSDSLSDEDRFPEGFPAGGWRSKRKSGIPEGFPALGWRSRRPMELKPHSLRAGGTVADMNASTPTPSLCVRHDHSTRVQLRRGHPMC